MLRNISKTLFFTLPFLLITSCSETSYQNKDELIKAVRPNVKEVTAKELKDKIAKQEEEFTLIDVRQKPEFENGAIEGAVNIPRGVLEFKINDDAFWEEEYMYPPTDTTLIILYCKHGSRSILAGESLIKLGYKNISYLKGGYTGYTSNIRRDKLM